MLLLALPGEGPPRTSRLRWQEGKAARDKVSNLRQNLCASRIVAPSFLKAKETNQSNHFSHSLQPFQREAHGLPFPLPASLLQKAEGGCLSSSALTRFPPVPRMGLPREAALLKHGAKRTEEETRLGPPAERLKSGYPIFF